MTETTPGRRLHAALLAHGIEHDKWHDCHETYHAAYEAAAREYDAARRDAPTVEDDAASAPGSFLRARGCLAPGWVDPGPTGGDDCGTRIDGLTAKVAALRRDRENDLAAFAEIGDRLGRCEQMAGDAYGRDIEICDLAGNDRERIARCEGRQGEIIERLGKLERAERAHERAIEHRTAVGIRRLNDHESRLGTLEARARDGGDPLRRTP